MPLLATLPSPPPTMTFPISPRRQQQLVAQSTQGGVTKAVPAITFSDDNLFDRAFLGLLSRELPQIRRNPPMRLRLDEEFVHTAPADAQSDLTRVPSPASGCDALAKGVDGMSAEIHTARSTTFIFGTRPETAQARAEDERRRLEEHVQALRHRLHDVEKESAERIKDLEKMLRRAERSKRKRSDQIERMTATIQEQAKRLAMYEHPGASTMEQQLPTHPASPPISSFASTSSLGAESSRTLTRRTPSPCNPTTLFASASASASASAAAYATTDATHTPRISRKSQNTNTSTTNQNELYMHASSPTTRTTNEDHVLPDQRLAFAHDGEAGANCRRPASRQEIARGPAACPIRTPPTSPYNDNAASPSPHLSHSPSPPHLLSLFSTPTSSTSTSPSSDAFTTPDSSPKGRVLFKAETEPVCEWVDSDASTCASVICVNSPAVTRTRT